MTNASDKGASTAETEPESATEQSSPADDALADPLGSALAQQLTLSEAGSEPRKESKGEEIDDAAAESSPFLLLCDLGYGIPKEGRPRKEKILAIARQIVNFLSWQYATSQQESSHCYRLAHVILVDCHDASVEQALLDRMKELWHQEQNASTAAVAFPSHVSFSKRPLESYLNNKKTSEEKDSLVYLSPDADRVLCTSTGPPRAVVIGMLIDRRIQVDRSRNRSQTLQIPSARWPAIAGLDPKEPFNVDCIMEGMQQWDWSWHNDEANGAKDDDCFQQAALQAWRHHQDRHPQRPKHL